MSLRTNQFSTGRFVFVPDSETLVPLGIRCAQAVENIHTRVPLAQQKLWVRIKNREPCSNDPFKQILG